MVFVEVIDTSGDDASMGQGGEEDIIKTLYTRHINPGNYLEIRKELFSLWTLKSSNMMLYSLPIHS